MNRGIRLEALVASVRSCHVCERMDRCHVLGPANGREGARVMFVGEAPGRFGAGRSGVPFSGDEAGRRFEALLARADMERDQVFVTNAVLCNPLDSNGRNRRPLRSEIAACLPFLRAQIDVIDPLVVVTLGGVALEALARVQAHNVTLSSGCASPIEWFGRLLVPLYHPGRRALVHRAEAQQRADWERLSSIVRERVASTES